MKPIFIFLILLLSIQCFSQKARRIACVGNSITFGYGINPREQNSYPGQLQAMLGDGYDVRNFGVSGRTLLRNGNHPYWKEKAFHDAMAFKPDVVFIMLGTNDSKAVNRPYFNQFERDYSDLIDSFRALSTHPRVIMVLPIATFNADSNSIYDPVIVKKIIPMCESVAFKKQVEFIDLHPMFLGRENELFDKIHPNSIGDTRIAQRLYEQLQLTPAHNDRFFKKIPSPTSIKNYHGYQCVEFKFEGRECKIVRPYAFEKGNPWIWRARFWGNQPQAELGLLERGFYLAYCDVAELYGNKACIDIWNKFYAFLHTRLGLNAKVALEGYSRGGIYIYNWAAANPEKVACVYADAPVLDFKSWPGGKGTGPGSQADWALFQKDYGLRSEQQAVAFRGAPIYRAKEIIAGHYPMLHVVGDADTVVPVSENTTPFVKNIRALGGAIEVIHKPGMFHHPHSLANPERIINFILHATEHK
ncbi:GDSL-type esterase/lipase family protein [Arachidicoccus terrestris]|uniref:GDSL-type esterase/lipase family protein n=1 Tax=Arachidicoccus terrestris TaxID=2875539 RepID=UPI001CC7CA95|nr:GDSL-type esterase/lipase family protein [Arachidicoccus terrestris]UAY55346.1 prolyl oligopeptidase family serine peptidase [Arachidicoccus terrestris]